MVTHAPQKCGDQILKLVGIELPKLTFEAFTCNLFSLVKGDFSFSSSFLLFRFLGRLLGLPFTVSLLRGFEEPNRTKLESVLSLWC